jgi:hypothetical protein
MPYLRLDLAKTYPSQTKRDLAARLCHLYADVMQTQLWRPNVGIAELPSTAAPNAFGTMQPWSDQPPQLRD